MVIIEEDPERVHQDQYKKIGKLFEPKYTICDTVYVDRYLIEGHNGPGEASTNLGSITIAKNNKDVTINGSPNLFMDIAKEIEKLGYSVVIVY